MIGNSGEAKDTGPTSDDLLFACDYCRIPLIVDRAAAGLTVTCHACGKPITIPGKTSSSRGIPESSPGEKLIELRGHLKENESQRTEVKGYLNQLSIQVHRWQLRLQALDERNSQLKSQIAVLSEEI